MFHPDFNEPFEMHIDTSLCQIGAVITLDGEPVVFCSRKLKDGQHSYTTTERELLAMVGITKGV